MMRGRRLLPAAFLAAFALQAVPTQAGGNLNRLGREREAARQARELEGRRIVEGRWHLETSGDEGYRSGTIIERRGNRDTGRRIEAYGGDELNCGFPAFPHDDGASGTFYLSRDGRHWRIVHFVPDEATLERDRSGPPAQSREQ